MNSQDNKKPSFGPESLEAFISKVNNHFPDELRFRLEGDLSKTKFHTLQSRDRVRFTFQTM